MSAEQSEPQVASELNAARSIKVIFQNQTSFNLERGDLDLYHGKWTENEYPPEKIGAGENKSWQSQSNGMLAGTEGYVYYTRDRNRQVDVYWDNPYSDSNSDRSTVFGMGDYKLPYSGGGGNNATVTFIFQPK